MKPARKDLSRLFSPSSIAVVGASRDRSKIGHILVKNIIDSGYKGRIYPVNPVAKEILRLKAFPDYASLPEVPDLAVISVPAAVAVQVLSEIATKGTKNVVVITAGFRESNAEGAELEAELVRISKEYNINLLGPNCLGFVNNIDDLNVSFGKSNKTPGNLKFISQSGAVATSIFDWAESIGLGFSDFITIGNKAVTNENDILEFWLTQKREIPPAKEHILNDPRISRLHPIGIYLEALNEGEEFINTVSQITLNNPVFILKPGKSSATKKAIQSHTGSIAGENAVLDTAFREAGIIRCEGVEDMFDLAKVFSWEKAPKGPNVAIVSNAGGPAVISTDFIQEAGLKLAELSTHTSSQLAKCLPRSVNIHDPVDVQGDALAARYGSAIDIVLGQKDVHALLVILTPQIMTQIHRTAEFIARLASVHNKPVICSFMGGTAISEGETVLNRFKIPSFRFPERAIHALGKMWWWYDYSSRRAAELKVLASNRKQEIFETADENKISKIFEIAKKRKFRSVAAVSQSPNDKSIIFTPFETNEILKSWNIPTPPTCPVFDIYEALNFTKEYGWPVVLKVSSNKIMHKTELGGVIININNRAKLTASFAEIQRRINAFDPEIRKTCVIQIQEQVTHGVETILGVKKDPSFGHILMFGAGGTLAELIQDRNLALVSVSRLDAEKLIAGSKVAKVLNGYRGSKRLAVAKLAFVIERLSQLVEKFSEIEEFEINPLIVTEESVWAVDGKGIIQINPAEA